VAALERLAHELGVADALEAVVGAAAGELDEVRDEVALDLVRVDEVGHAEARAEASRLG
jgi:VIT1/CCC1 family predicted Fe2+/Mn2+ transporter